MGELRNVVVDAISLVKKGANGEPIQIYKSAEETPETPLNKEASVEPTTETSTDNNLEATVQKSVLDFFKGLFAPVIKSISPELTEKSADIDDSVDHTSFTSRMTDPRSQVWDAGYTLMYTMDSIFWDDSLENGKELILRNIDEFKDYVSKVLNSDRTTQSAFFEKGANEPMKKEDILAAVAEATAPLTKSLEELADKISSLEKADETPATDPAAETEVEKSGEVTESVVETPVEKSAEIDIAAVIKSAIGESLAPISKSVTDLGDRLETLENLKGLSNGATVTGKTEKSAEVDEWPEFRLFK